MALSGSFGEMKPPTLLRCVAADEMQVAIGPSVGDKLRLYFDRPTDLGGHVLRARLTRKELDALVLFEPPLPLGSTALWTDTSTLEITLEGEDVENSGLQVDWPGFSVSHPA